MQMYLLYNLVESTSDKMQKNITVQGFIGLPAFGGAVGDQGSRFGVSS